MSTITNNNKRIAKNTMFLYIRTFITLTITLFTSRVILQKLGVEDYGIYNVVGSIVVMMGVFNNAMSTATQRFLSYELGRGNSLGKVFSISLSIYILLSIILVVLCETIGIWFLNYKLVIPEERLGAANWVFQLSILASINSLLMAPYNSMIVAQERMNIYAYVSIIEVSLKLLIVYLLDIFDFDRLVIYAILVLFCQVIVTMIYRIYCFKNFKEVKFGIVKDIEAYKKILTFTGWNIIGSVAVMGKTQGLNVVINMFFSPAVNASRGIAVQVNHAVHLFFSNFYMAFRPQITKYYASGDIDNMNRLVHNSTRYSYYLVFLFTFPLCLETEFVINLWLGQTPEYVLSFTRLILLITAVDSLANPLMTVVQATGNLKVYQLVISTTLLLNVPLSYFALRAGMTPDVVFYISLSISIICYVLRLFIANNLVHLNLRDYLLNVLAKIVLVSIIASIIPLIIYLTAAHNTATSILTMSTCGLSTIIAIYLVGINTTEKMYLWNYVNKKIKR